MARRWLIVVLSVLAFPACAAAQSDFTWTGASSDPSTANPANWSGAVAPAGSADALDFPSLQGAGCVTCRTVSIPAPGLSAGSVSLDDAYNVTGSRLTIGAGGLTVAGPGATLAAPVSLGASQTWMVTGGTDSLAQSLLAIGTSLDGPGKSFNVTLADHGNLGLAGNAELGPVTISGIGIVAASDLNGDDGMPVRLNQVTLWGVRTSTGPVVEVTGPLTSAGATLILEGTGSVDDTTTGEMSPEYDVAISTLSVHGDVVLDAATSTDIALADGSWPSAQLAATGSVHLAGTLGLAAQLDGDYHLPLCTAQAGDVVTIVTAAMGITGTFSNAPDGSLVKVGCAGQARISYGPTAVTATVVGRRHALTVSPAQPVTNQPVTLTETVHETFASRAAVTFRRGSSTTLAHCEGPVTYSDSGYEATCSTSFSASPSVQTADADVSSGNGDPPETDSVNVTVDRATTRARLAAGQRSANRLTYTASVVPEFAGPVYPGRPVAFYDDWHAVAGCAAVPVDAIAPASCAVPMTRPGRHRITARYSGDRNFLASVTGASFPVAPSVRTTPPLRVSARSATLRGVIGDRGRRAKWRVALWRVHGRRRLTRLRQLRGRARPFAVSARVAGLAPHAGYRYRVLVTTRGRHGSPAVSLAGPVRRLQTS